MKTLIEPLFWWALHFMSALSVKISFALNYFRGHCVWYVCTPVISPLAYNPQKSLRHHQHHLELWTSGPVLGLTSVLIGALLSSLSSAGMTRSTARGEFPAYSHTVKTFWTVESFLFFSWWLCKEILRVLWFSDKIKIILKNFSNYLCILGCLFTIKKKNRRKPNKMETFFGLGDVKTCSLLLLREN